MSHDETLAAVPLFSGLTPEEMAEVVPLTEEARFEEGVEIVHMGDPGSSLFVILEGSVEVVLPGRSQDLELARLGAGDFFGEMALLNQEPRSATVRTLTPVRALVLGREEFRSLIQRSGDVALHLLEALSLRIRNTDQQLGGLGEQVLRDPLTGLLNRRAFHERLSEETNRAQRYEEPFSLLLLDVDRFKAVNDTLGHDAGDDALRWIARVLAEHTRAADAPFRIGGEEFAILAPKTSAEMAQKAGERIRQVISESRVPGSRELSLTVSIGYATFPDHARRAEDLFRLADQGVLRAKSEGRNRTQGPDTPEGVAPPPRTGRG